MKHDDLRMVLGGPIWGLHHRTNTEGLLEIGEWLGLDLANPQVGGMAKRLAHALASAQNSRLPGVAERYLARYQPPPAERRQIEDVLWRGEGAEIPKKCRRALAQALAGEDLFLKQPAFEVLLRDLWQIEEAAWGSTERSELARQVRQHVYRNKDWSLEELFEAIGAIDAVDLRFAKFLEGLVSADVRPDEAAQRRFVGLANDVLRDFGIELRECGDDGGYPDFALASLRSGALSAPKNLIFGSPVKPDLRLRDSVSKMWRPSRTLTAVLSMTARSERSDSRGGTCRRSGRNARDSRMRARQRSHYTGACRTRCRTIHRRKPSSFAPFAPTTITQLLADLSAANCQIAIVTSSPRTYFEEVAKAHGFPLAPAICYHDCPPGKCKPHPFSMTKAAKMMNLPPSSVIAVGDAPGDIRAARSAGICAVAVTWGLRDPSALLESMPDEVFDSVEKLAGRLLAK